MRKIFAALFASALLMFPIAASAGKSVYVRMANTQILAGPSASAKELATVQKGDELAVLDEEGKYYKVKTSGGVTGFVFRFNVADSKPTQPKQGKDSGGEADDLLGSLGGNRTAKMDEDSSSHSIRGLTRSGPGKSAGLTKQEVDGAVKGMESLSVTPGDLSAFQKEGGLHGK